MTQHTLVCDWQMIWGAPSYRVCQHGQVLSLTPWRGQAMRLLNQTPNSDGYPSVRLRSTMYRKRIAVHRLVASAFLDRPLSSNHEIRHLDGDKDNPHRDNLAWGTAQENADDRERHGRTSRGERHSVAIKRGLALARGEQVPA